jgi:hypothetical protein
VNRTLALLVLMLGTPPLAYGSCTRWEGTITSDAGMSGVFRAVTRPHPVVPPTVMVFGLERGRFRCRGPGCPGRHGLFTVTYTYLLPQMVVVVDGVFGPASHKLTCDYVGPTTDSPSIDASYQCFSLRDRTTSTFLFGGTLQLSPHRCHP